jgi:hypothetical protein
MQPGRLQRKSYSNQDNSTWMGTSGRVGKDCGFEDYDDTANYHLAAEISGAKSGERVEIVGDDDFVDRMLIGGCRLNYQQEKEVFRPTDSWQRGRSEVLDHRHVRPEMGYDDPAASQQADDREDDAPTVNSYWGPSP